MHTYRDFLKKLLVLSGLLALLLALLNYSFAFFRNFAPFSWASLGIFIGISVLTGYLGFKAIEKSAHGFVSGVSATIMLRLLLSLVFLILWILMMKPADAAFILSFFTFYIVFAAFEIRELVAAQKKQKPETP